MQRQREVLVVAGAAAQVGWASVVGSGAMVGAVLIATARLLLAPGDSCQGASGHGRPHGHGLPSIGIMRLMSAGSGALHPGLAPTQAHGSLEPLHAFPSLPRRLLGVGSALVLVAGGGRARHGGPRREWIAHDGFAPGMVSISMATEFAQIDKPANPTQKHTGSS